MILNKSDLVANIAERGTISKAEAERQLNTVMDGLELAISKMKDGDKLQLMGLLTFEVTHREAYIGKNPKTQEDIEVPAVNRLRVKAGKTLTDSVN